MEYFSLNDKKYGFILELADLLSDSLKLQVRADTTKKWGEAFNGLQTGEIDILFGANETEERKKTMLFSEALYKIPYSLLSNHGSGIFVVGDLENRDVGFIDGDIIMSLFPEYYKSISYHQKIYDDQNNALAAIEDEEIDAFITTGGIIVHDYLKEFPKLKEVKILNNFTSDMTLSVNVKNPLLASILNKFIKKYNSVIETKVREIKYLYNYKVLELSNEEIKWILENRSALYGVTEGYLPFDYLENNEFKGISAAILKEISLLTDIEFIPVKEEFNTLYEDVKTGKIDIMNLAKTSDRLNDFYYTSSFSSERDNIYGQLHSPAIQDIYELENYSVAIVEGYYHEELLVTNSINAEIIKTQSLKESMELILKGKADYMIENPSVMKYFINEWDMFELTEKGLTSADSFLYFGVSKSKPELMSIMNKAMDAIDLETVFNEGFNEIPFSSDRDQIVFQLSLITLLILILIALIIFAHRQARALVNSKQTTEKLREREELMYRDPMTQAYNRHYLYHKVEPFINKWKYPQTVIVCDLNNLKLTNDKWGHSTGDLLLSKFGLILKDSFEREDILIRLGGDEFMIIIIGKTVDYVKDAIATMEAKMKISEIPASEEDVIIPSTAWGMATRYHNSETSFENLQIEADDNMYSHKRDMKKES